MSKIALALISLFIPLACFAQNTTLTVPPKEDKKEITIPKNLEECFRELEMIMTKEKLEEFKNKKESDVVSYHFGLGMWIRNNWGLWSGSRLAKYFNALGIFHPDDMSGIILDSFHRHLNNKDIGLEKQIQSYKDYWEKVKTDKQGLNNKK